MLAKIQNFVKKYQSDIILVIGVILISLLSFAMGYIVAKIQEKEPLKIEQNRYEFYTNYIRIDYSYIRKPNPSKAKVEGERREMRTKFSASKFVNS